VGQNDGGGGSQVRPASTLSVASSAQLGEPTMKLKTLEELLVQSGSPQARRCRGRRTPGASEKAGNKGGWSKTSDLGTPEGHHVAMVVQARLPVRGGDGLLYRLLAGAPDDPPRLGGGDLLRGGGGAGRDRRQLESLVGSQARRRWKAPSSARASRSPASSPRVLGVLAILFGATTVFAQVQAALNNSGT
jgi:hypothetical protein